MYAEVAKALALRFSAVSICLTATIERTTIGVVAPRRGYDYYSDSSA